jgi:hypothetical protein
MAHKTLTEHKTAIGDVIRWAAPTAVVFERWILPEGEGQIQRWPGLLRSPSDSDRTHGYVIEVASSPPIDRNTRERMKAGFNIVGLHYHLESGTDTSALVMAEIEKLDATFNRYDGQMSPFPETLGGVERFSWVHRLVPFSGEQCHLVVMQLELTRC